MIDEKNNEGLTPEAERVSRETVARVFWDKVRNTVEDLKNSEKIGVLIKAEKDTEVRDLVLLGLAIIELVPVAEMLNEGSKWATVLKKAEQLAPKVKKEGKLAGIILNLYPDIPTWLVAATAGLDTIGVPFVGAAPEVLQLAIDLLWNDTKTRAGLGKEVVDVIKRNFFEKSEYEQQQIKEAQLAFVKMEEK